MTITFDKPASIQEKLKSWVRATPSMDLLQSRLIEATNRRQNRISKVSRRASAHCSGVKNALIDHQAQKNTEVKAIREKASAKSDRAVFNLAAKVTKAAEDNKIVAARVEQVHKRRKSEMIKIQCKHENKLESAAKRKERIQEKAYSPDDKLERAKLHKLANDANLSTVQKRLDDKMLTVIERKELNVASKAAKAAEDNKIVATRVDQVQKKRESAINEIQCKHEIKLQSATKRKEEHQEADILKRETFNLRRQKALQTFEDKQNTELPKAKQNISVKLEEASARREKLLIEKAEQAAFIGSPKGTTSHSRKVSSPGLSFVATSPGECIDNSNVSS